MLTKKKKIGEILIEENLITREILDEALLYQKRYGGGVTQFLIAYGYINEEDLAKCISEQFKIPYLSLRVYNIPNEVIEMVPIEIVERHWLMPVDRMHDIFTVVMADPLDADAIAEVEKATGCAVQPFVGILSDIIQAIEHYYHIVIKDDKLKTGHAAPLFIDTNAYRGMERRKSVRLNVKMDIHFPAQDIYKKSKTRNVGLHGFAFESDNILPLWSYVTLQLDLPEEYSPSPIAAVVQVVRATPLKNGRFDIGTKLIRMPREDARLMIKYAREHQE